MLVLISWSCGPDIVAGDLREVLIEVELPAMGRLRACVSRSWSGVVTRG